MHQYFSLSVNITIITLPCIHIIFPSKRRGRPALRTLSGNKLLNLVSSSGCFASYHSLHHGMLSTSFFLISLITMFFSAALKITWSAPENQVFCGIERRKRGKWFMKKTLDAMVPTSNPGSIRCNPKLVRGTKKGYPIECPWKNL